MKKIKNSTNEKLSYNNEGEIAPTKEQIKEAIKEMKNKNSTPSLTWPHTKEQIKKIVSDASNSK